MLTERQGLEGESWKTCQLPNNEQLERLFQGEKRASAKAQGQEGAQGHIHGPARSQ